MSNSENKTLVIGDMHLKEELILSWVDQAIKKLDVNRVVFCGDYVDEWHSNRSIMLDAIDDFLTWIDGKRKHGFDVDFVLGNHDMQYLRGIPGPGTHTDLYKEVSEALTYMKVQMACVVGNYVVTHAGITREWAYRFLTSDQGKLLVRFPMLSMRCFDVEMIKLSRHLTVQGQVVVEAKLPVHFGRIYQSSIKIHSRVSIKLLDILPLNPLIYGRFLPKMVHVQNQS